MRLDQVLKLAPVVGLKAHLVDLVEDLRALVNGKLLEHLVNVGALTSHSTSLCRIHCCRGWVRLNGVLNKLHTAYHAILESLSHSLLRVCALEI